MRTLLVALLLASLSGCKNESGTRSVPKDYKERVSYAIGLNIGNNLNKDSIDIDMDMFVQGVRDGAKDSSRKLLSPEDLATVQKDFDQEMRRRQSARAEALADKNKKEGEAFLEANKKNPGVVVLPSGLQYQVIKEGTGPIPKANQNVIAHYTGWTIDGVEFDNSHKRGQPATFPVTGVIPGWSEALQKMKVGSVWKIFVPSELAYGAQGSRGTIAPNATLVFQIELLGIQ